MSACGLLTVSLSPPVSQTHKDRQCLANTHSWRTSGIFLFPNESGAFWEHFLYCREPRSSRVSDSWFLLNQGSSSCSVDDVSDLELRLEMTRVHVGFIYRVGEDGAPCFSPEGPPTTD